MSKNIYNANFWQLLTKYQVEIPIIQRDYVQGREENKRIRKKIISKFNEALSGKPTKLDFIYGNVKNNIFYPLDGQQRLTTLFLYYLYFAIRDSKTVDNNIKQVFSKFTYSTRTSSKEFFDKLINAEFNILKETQISQMIIDQNWFISYWQNDPTVAAVLNMISEIHSQCFNATFDFDYLIREDNKNITFEFLELEKFGLSDDLYIKMNARGKTLSPFENFKADLINLIKKNEWEVEVPYNDLFSKQLDGEWTEYFWNEGRDTSNFDKFFINFFHQFFITEIITRNELSSQILKTLSSPEDEDSSQKSIYIDELLSKLIASADDLEVSYLDIYAFKHLYSLLDLYASISRRLKINFDLWIKDFTSIDDLINGKSRITYASRVFHFAHSCYLVKNTNHNNEDYNKWMRVVRNIITNSTIDTVETFRGTIQLINELSEGSGSIYEFLAKDNIKSKFAERQVSEEIRKSKLINQNTLVYIDLMKIEDIRLCYGRIEFILNYIEDCCDANFSIISDMYDLIIKYFNDSDFSNQLRSLFLTCGDGKFYEYWASSWVKVVQLPKRCLIENTIDLRNYSYNITFRKYLYELFNKLLTRDDIQFHLDQYILSDNYSSVPIWKQNIIQDYSILDKYCLSRMIAIAHDDSKCYLMKIGKPRSKDSLKKIY
jgi:hypothetical protein